MFHAEQLMRYSVESRFKGTAIETGRVKGGHDGPGKGWPRLSHGCSKEAGEGRVRRTIKEVTYMQPVLCFAMQVEGV